MNMRLLIKQQRSMDSAAVEDWCGPSKRSQKRYVTIDSHQWPTMRETH